MLEDAELREGIKQFSNWPTIPQLYVKGEFVGGADIVREPADTFWGGYAGYFQDPDGHLWEIVWNPNLQPED